MLNRTGVRVLYKVSVARIRTLRVKLWRHAKGSPLVPSPLSLFSFRANTGRSDDGQEAQVLRVDKVLERTCMLGATMLAAVSGVIFLHVSQPFGPISFPLSLPAYKLLLTRVIPRYG